MIRKCVDVCDFYNLTLTPSGPAAARAPYFRLRGDVIRGARLPSLQASLLVVVVGTAH